MNFRYLIAFTTLALLSIAGLGKLIDPPYAAAAATVQRPLAQVQSPLTPTAQVQSPLTPTAAQAANRPVCATVLVDDDVEHAHPARQRVILGSAAQQVAEAFLKTGCASEIELDEEDDQLVYTVQIGRTEVEVDAITGTVLDIDYDED